jgi:hypothetical protein
VRNHVQGNKRNEAILLSFRLAVESLTPSLI